MTRFMSDKYRTLTPYVPGEQPKVTGRLIKLNTNENPYPPSPKAIAAAAEAAKTLRLYSDTQCTLLREALAKTYGVDKDEIMCANSSDESLDYAFLTFCDKDRPAVFPDITYGFYPVYCDLYGIPYTEIPLKEDFTVDISDYTGIGKNIFIANPNAPTGIALKRDEIEQIVKSNPDNIVLIDEAYVDFGAESCVPLIHRYDNLIVTMTYSKSRSMAGARLGFTIANKALIADMNTIRFSRSPYNVNSMTIAAGAGALADPEYMAQCRDRIIATRTRMNAELEKRGFTCLPSCTNFIFAKSDRVGGKELYLKLKDMGIFIRHFDRERLTEFNRITVGTDEQIDELLKAIDIILSEKAGA
ncbi:MAG: histidinol-phosphate transaminase [Clostridiales bacterium]|nr:histidinol-phosphate transaminase [Clostridiales bacterium]